MSLWGVHASAGDLRALGRAPNRAQPGTCGRWSFYDAPVVGEGASDKELVASALTGDQAAWDALVERHGGRVWAVARAHRLSTADGEDVFQVTFLKLVTHLHTIRDPTRLGAWLATTARYESLRVLRRAGRTVLAGDDNDLEEREPALVPVDAALLAHERDGHLHVALGRLSERCQRLLRVLMADPEPTYAEVGVALEMPVGSIGPTRGRCLEHLRRELGGI